MSKGKKAASISEPEAPVPSDFWTNYRLLSASTFQGERRALWETLLQQAGRGVEIVALSAHRTMIEEQDEKFTAFLDKNNSLLSDDNVQALLDRLPMQKLLRPAADGREPIYSSQALKCRIFLESLQRERFKARTLARLR